MSEPVEIQEAHSDAELSLGRGLIEQYAEALGVNLDFQNLTDELSRLGEVYGPPRGCLLIARRAGEPVGCVALRGLDEGLGEMKRLYVRPSRRRSGAGRLLVSAVIERAQLLGYRRMVLDTLSSMQAALALYRSFGFRKTAPYYANPLPGVVYLALDLAPAPVELV